jgi:hypothetical protein
MMIMHADDLYQLLHGMIAKLCFATVSRATSSCVPTARQLNASPRHGTFMPAQHNVLEQLAGTLLPVTETATFGFTLD